MLSFFTERTDNIVKEERSPPTYDSLLNRGSRKVISKDETIFNRSRSAPVIRGPDLDRREPDRRKPSDRREYPDRSRGPYYYYRPYYHRRFIFISLGGYWPCYPYVRYYWYPCHFYSWYGPCPPEYVITGDTYNYYYYGDSDQRVQVPGPDALKEKPPEKPGEVTQTDRYFEEGVKVFEAGNYATAAAKFQDALKQAPDDIILPFAYVQALFSDGQYKKATEVLRESLSKASPEKEGVFYPRGLYTDENVLKEQIERLSRAVSLNPSDLDLQLLLGYQLLGIGRIRKRRDCFWYFSRPKPDSIFSRNLAFFYFH